MTAVGTASMPILDSVGLTATRTEVMTNARPVTIMIHEPLATSGDSAMIAVAATMPRTAVAMRTALPID